MLAAKQAAESSARPDVFTYHDYRAFLRDWLEHLKQSRPGFSARWLAREAGVASGYLPMVITGKRSLSNKAWLKLAPLLGLSASERSYLQELQTIEETNSQQVRLEAFERIQRFQSYRRSNPKETTVYRYLTRWFYVAIREMAALPGFRADAVWVQENLRARVPLSEIKHALDFLLKNGYIELRPDGTAYPPQKQLECVGGVFKMALGKFHKEMLSLASESIQSVSSQSRNITGHTFAIAADQFEQVREILDEALKKIAAVGEQSTNTNCVYHIAMAAFPLTQLPRKEERDDDDDSK